METPQKSTITEEPLIRRKKVKTGRRKKKNFAQEEERPRRPIEVSVESISQRRKGEEKKPNRPQKGKTGRGGSQDGEKVLWEGKG